MASRLETYKSHVRRVNKAARARDESHLWPINGRFNVTERAIRRLARIDIQFDDYEAELEAEISQIVNDESNW